MQSLPDPRSPWIQPLDRAGWSLIADRVIHGLCHDINGRAGSLSGLTFLLESQEGDASSVLPFLNQELAQLEGVVRLLHLLPDDATDPELLAPGELMPELALLIRVQRGLEGVEFDLGEYSSAPAVRMDRTLFIRSLAILLTGAAERVVVQGLEGVAIRASGTGGRLSLEVWPGPGKEVLAGPDPEILPRKVIVPEGVRLWKEVLRGEGVEVEEEKGGELQGALQLVFPSPSS